MLNNPNDRLAYRSYSTSTGSKPLAHSTLLHDNLTIHPPPTLSAYNNSEPSCSKISLQTSNNKISHSLVNCPVCNKSFSSEAIEVHVDLCIEKTSSNPFIVRNDDLVIFNSDDEVEEIFLKHEGTLEKSQSELMKELINDCRQPNQLNICKLHVRRMHAFSDFMKFFSRNWNASKKEDMLAVTFIGEAGVDTGGPLKELFSRMLHISFLRIIIFCKINFQCLFFGIIINSQP